MRRTRAKDFSRRMVRETQPSADDLIWPLVISDRVKSREPVPSMPGVDRLSVREAAKAAEQAQSLGIPCIALFPNIDPALKDARGSEAANPDGLVPDAVKAIKDAAPEIGVMVDVALDPYTDHGHDGILEGGVILNDPSTEILVETGLMLAACGADIVGPSDMMDGRVGALRRAFETAGQTDIIIMSYAAKYASGFYGPYRDAIGTASALSGDKRTYQMDPGNRAEALREVALDIGEGADMVMVKPGLPYLDIIREVKSEFGMPTFAFQVSGEYAMIRAAAANGWADGERVMLETMQSFRRAGCDGVLTYFAPQLAQIYGG